MGVLQEELEEHAPDLLFGDFFNAFTAANEELAEFAKRVPFDTNLFNEFKNYKFRDTGGLTDS